MITKSIILAGREVPLKTIENYILFLRKPIRTQDIGGFDNERSRLHNAIFNSAGLQDGKFAKARNIGYGADLNDPIEAPYGRFNDALENLLCDALACPVCGKTLDRNQKCMRPLCANYGHLITGRECVKTLHRIAIDTREIK